MSVAVVFSRGLAGLDAPVVRVEAHVGTGLPQFHIVAGGSFNVLSLVSRRQGGDRSRRVWWIDDGCSAETVVGRGEGGFDLIAEQDDVGNPCTIDHG